MKDQGLIEDILICNRIEVDSLCASALEEKEYIIWFQDFDDY